MIVSLKANLAMAIKQNLNSISEIICGTPPEIENGYLVVPYNMTLDSVATYVCDNESYALIGAAHIRCQSSEQWTLAPQCLCKNSVLYADLLSRILTAQASSAKIKRLLLKKQQL